ncbi:MAG: 30S ribosomal protein S6 [Chloroflexota bacterium]
MREYELMFVVHPDLDETAFAEMVKRVSSWIVDGGGEVVKTDIWGKRQLAYPIRKINQGQYVLLTANMAPGQGTQLERNLGFQEQILRYMLVAK